MSAFTFPHAVTVTPYTEDETDGIIGDPIAGASVALYASIDPSPSSATLSGYGVEAENPAVLYCPSSDVSSYPQGARVESEMGTYTVIGRAVLVGPGSNLAHGKALLDRA